MTESELNESVPTLTWSATTSGDGAPHQPAEQEQIRKVVRVHYGRVRPMSAESRARPGGRFQCSTKAGAFTPATRVLCALAEEPDRMRSTKAGALTPATLLFLQKWTTEAKQGP